MERREGFTLEIEIVVRERRGARVVGKSGHTTTKSLDTYAGLTERQEIADRIDSYVRRTHPPPE